jgi:hypothetical protein
MFKNERFESFLFADLKVAKPTTYDSDPRQKKHAR